MAEHLIAQIVARKDNDRAFRLQMVEEKGFVMRVLPPPGEGDHEFSFTSIKRCRGAACSRSRGRSALQALVPERVLVSKSEGYSQ